MIEVLQLTKRYRRNTAVDDLTFTARPGVVTGFLGVNGSGKSTTIRTVLGLARPDAGSTRVLGRPYPDLRYPVRQVGALLESSAAHRGLTVSGHLSWIAQSNRVDRGRVAHVLDLVGLAEAGRRRVGALSLGMTQRLGLATALLGDPPVLVLDEPLNGLDAEGIRWLRSLLSEMAAEGRTILVSSHLMAEMSMIANRLVVIHKGRLLADSSPADLVERNTRTHVQVRTPDSVPLSRELALRGVSSTLAANGALRVVGLPAAEINKLASARGWELEELSTVSGSLEDAFLNLIGSGEGSAR